MRRLWGLAAVLALAVTACSIEAPVEVTGEGARPAADATGAGGTASDDLGGGTIAPGDAGGGGGATDGTGGAGGDGTGDATAAGGGGSGEAGTATAAGSGGDGGGSAAAAGGGATDVGVTADRIKVGSLFALSGPVSSISAPILYGVNAYFRAINDAGGVNGRMIELVYYDDGYDPQRGAGLIRRLVEQDKVFALTVVPSSSSLEAATQYLEDKKVPVIGTSGLVETQFQAPMQFPVGASTVVATHVGLKWAHDTMKYENLAVIYVDLLAGEYALNAAEGSAERLGVDVCSKQRVPLNQPDYGPVWLNIQTDCGGSVDYVLLAIDPSSAIKAITAAKNQRFKPEKGWGGGAPLFLDLVLRGTGQYAVGLTAVTSYYPPVGEHLQRPAVKQYVDTVRKYSPSGIDVTNPYLEGGYVGAALAVEAFKRAGGNLTRQAVLDALNNLENWTIGLTKPMTFKGGNKYANSNVMVAEIASDGSGLSWRMVSDFIADPWPGQDLEL